MRVLLSDGSGLSSRQTARLLHRAGHDVGVLTAEALCVCAHTRTVQRVHVIAPTAQPDAWFTAAVREFHDGDYDLLLPTQEQVAILARHRQRLDELGIPTAVPDFDELAAVFDKVAANTTLERLGIARPPTQIVTTPDQVDRYPVYAKLPVATGSTGVRYARSPAELANALDTWRTAGRLGTGPIVAQTPVDGPLVMVQTVFDRGRILAAHANERTREGVGGGASHKCSVVRSDAIEPIRRLGGALGWHGALSADVIITPDGPMVIDVNPRLVEPGNAAASGVDLVAPMIDIAMGRSPTTQPAGRPGVRTHQTLLALAGSARQDRTRRAIAREAMHALTHTGLYRHSLEELTPARHDLRGTWPTIAAAGICLLAPTLHERFTTGATNDYSLGWQGWSTLTAHHVPES